MGERHAGRRGGREEGRIAGRETKKKHGSACSGLVMLKATKAKVKLLNGSQAIVWMILRTLAKWMCQRDVSGAWSWMDLTSSWTQGTDSYAPFCGLQRVCAHLFIHVLGQRTLHQQQWHCCSPSLAHLQEDARRSLRRASSFGFPTITWRILSPCLRPGGPQADWTLGGMCQAGALRIMALKTSNVCVKYHHRTLLPG